MEEAETLRKESVKQACGWLVFARGARAMYICVHTAAVWGLIKVLFCVLHRVTSVKVGGYFDEACRYGHRLTVCMCVANDFEVGWEVHRQLAVAVGHSYFRPSGVGPWTDTDTTVMYIVYITRSIMCPSLIRCCMRCVPFFGVIR